MADESNAPPTDESGPTSSSALSSPSPGSPAGPGGRVGTLSGTLVSMTVIAIISHAWYSGLLSRAPWWAPLGGLLIAAVPGGVLGSQLGFVGRAAVGALLDRLPKRPGK